MQIRIVPAGDPLVKQARSLVWERAPLVAMSGFGGDRANVVAYYVVALDRGLIIGLGSLAPTDEMGEPGPHIIAVWAEADAVASAGAAIIQALVNESVQRYSSAPTLIAVTPEEAQAAKVAHARGSEFQLIDQSRFGFGQGF